MTQQESKLNLNTDIQPQSRSEKPELLHNTIAIQTDTEEIQMDTIEVELNTKEIQTDTDISEFEETENYKDTEISKENITKENICNKGSIDIFSTEVTTVTNAAIGEREYKSAPQIIHLLNGSTHISIFGKLATEELLM